MKQPSMPDSRKPSWSTSPDAAPANPGHAPAGADIETELRQLREEVERSRSILRSAFTGATYVLDPNGCVIHWTENAEALLGYAEADIIGRSGDIVLAQDDQASGAFSAALGRAAILGRVATDGWHLRRDGTRLWASSTITTLRDTGGEPCGFLAILQDRTGSEPRQSGAEGTLSDPPAEPSDNLAMFPEIVSRLFSAPTSAVTILEPDRQRFRVSVGLDVTETTLEESFCRHAVMQPNDILYVPDATLDPRFADNPLVLRENGIRFYAGMPIRGPNGTAIGALCVIDSVPRYVGEALLDQLRKLAEGVNATLRLEASADTLRRREGEGKLTQAMLISVFQTVDAAVMVVRTNGAILLTNALCQSLLGYRAEELLRLGMADIVAPEGREALDAADAAQTTGAAPYRIETALLGHKGQKIPVRLTVALVKRRDVPPFRVITLQHHKADSSVSAPKPARTAVVGCIQFLGLQPVKAAYGAKWEGVKSRLLLAAENILKRRLSPEDSYSRTDDDSFSIWFKAGSEEDNAAHIARIRREIQTMLLGELGEETTSSVAAYTQAVDIDDPSLPQSEIIQRLSKRLAERRRDAEQQARAVLEEVMSEHPREATPIYAKNGAAIKAMFIDLPRSLRGRFAGSMSLVGGPNADIDAECLRLSLASDAAMEDMAEGLDRTQFIAIPIAVFATRRGRERFNAQWEEMPPKVGSQIFVMLSELPPDLSQARLFEAVSKLRPITRGVGVILDQIDPLPFQPQSSSLSMIGLSSRAFDGQRDPKIASFILRFQQAKLPVLVRLAKDEAPQRWYGLGASFTTLG